MIKVIRINDNFIGVSGCVKEEADFLPKVWNSSKNQFIMPVFTILDLITLFPYLKEDKEVLAVYNEQLKKQRNAFLKEFEKRNISPTFLTEAGFKNAELLRSYQLAAISFCYEVGGMLLGFEMGLGKGATALATSLLFKKQKGIKRVLIVCPNSIKKSVWEKEINKWTNESYLIVCGDKNKKEEDILSLDRYFYIVINYEALRERKNKKNKVADAIYKWKPDFIILDEAHAIKNKDALQTKALLKYKGKPTILATGTPVLNKVNELWCLLHFLDPVYWHSYKAFVTRYCIFEERHLMIFSYNRYTKKKQKQLIKVKEIVGSKNIEELQRRMGYWHMRRTKKEVMPYLPDRVYEPRSLEMKSEQLKLYNKLKEELELSYEGLSKEEIKTSIMQLLQVCDSTGNVIEEDSSCKFDECEKIVEDLGENHKIVFFTWFVKSANLLNERLSKKYNSLVITGETSLQKREEVIKKFQEDKAYNILIATISTCSFGLDFSMADVCVFVSRAYTPAVNDQAESRLHRSGQKNTVNVIILSCEGTIEERVNEILEEKKDLFFELFNKKGVRYFIK
jgi:SNF2 family DNA or RNA helicase